MVWFEERESGHGAVRGRDDGSGRLELSISDGVSPVVVEVGAWQAVALVAILSAWVMHSGWLSFGDEEASG